MIICCLRFYFSKDSVCRALDYVGLNISKLLYFVVLCLNFGFLFLDDFCTGFSFGLLKDITAFVNRIFFAIRVHRNGLLRFLHERTCTLNLCPTKTFLRIVIWSWLMLHHIAEEFESIGDLQLFIFILVLFPNSFEELISNYILFFQS